MSQASSAANPSSFTGIPITLKCEWSDKDILMMLNYIIYNCSKVGDGTNFMTAFWNIVVSHMLPFHQGHGGIKMAAVCSSK
jgi:hypothetical protein